MEEKQRKEELFQSGSSNQENQQPKVAAEESAWEEGLQDPLFLEAERSRLRMREVEATLPGAENRLPCFPPEVYDGLPRLLQQAVDSAKSDPERDIMLLGNLGVLSAVLPNVQGKYHQSWVYPNLFIFISGPASAGKGRLKRCLNLVMPIHREIMAQSEREQQDYLVQLAEQEASNGPKTPLKPPGQKMLVFPANNSFTGLIEQLANNGGRGLVFETEADTMSKMFRTDFGAYGEILRKAYHHEPISYNRRTDKEYVSVENPALSVVLAGTPRQVPRMFEDSEDGLFSRFLFYYRNTSCVWEDVFDENGDLDAFYRMLGDQMHAFYRQLQQRSSPLEFRLTDEQQLKFNMFFDHMQRVYYTMKNENFIATVRRIASSSFRIMMLLTALRFREQGGTAGTLVLEDRDFVRVLEMAEVLVKQSSFVFTGLPEVRNIVFKTQVLEDFWNALPDFFDKQTYFSIARAMGIPESTVDKKLSYFFVPSGILKRVAHGYYEKVKMHPSI